MSIEDLSKLTLEEVYPNPHLEDLDDDLDLPPINDDSQYFDLWIQEDEYASSESSF